ncbi:T9SS type A sorting domain-containing protein [Bacteroidota bacterium]
MKKFTYIFSAFMLLAITFFASESVAVKHTVLVGNFYFNPSNISDVQVGDTIRWQWVEGSHTTTSTSVPAGAATWDAPMNSGNQIFEYKVTIAGMYNYKCTPHSAIQTGSFTAVGATPTLTVTPSNQSVSADAGSTTFSITSNLAWTSNSDKSWCTVTPASGNGNGTITVTYTENPSADMRVAEITVTGDGILMEKVTVTQDGSSLGIEYKAEKAFTLYPNPTSGEINLIPGDVSNINMEACILDITGKTVTSEILSGSSQYKMNISNLPEGIYFLRLKDGERIVTKRIIRSNR